MRVDITGRHVDVTPALRQLIAKRLATLERVLNDSAVSALVIVTKEKYRHRVEMVVHARGDNTLSGLGEGNTWPLAIRAAAQKIEQQAKKLKGKWDSRKRQSAKVVRNRKVANDQEGPAAATPRAAAAPAPRVVRKKRYPVKPMSIDDAAARLDSGDEGFVVFRNAAEDDAITILYRRTDGNIGLIEPE